VAFADDVRNELAAIAPRRECDRLAELSALFHSAGSLHLRGRGEVSVHLDVASSAVARRAFTLLRSFRVRSEIRTYPRRAFDRSTRYQLHVAGTAHALQVLHEAGVLTANLAPAERPPKRVVGRPCCRAAYLRGALLAAGTVSAPPSTHLEMRAATGAAADFVADVAAAEGIRLRVTERVRHATAYAKGIDTVAHVLAVAGASDAALALEERAVVGATRSRANRLTNADHANLVRAGRAAHAQLVAVRRLARTRGLEQLSPPLREIAELRLRHPSLSLRELAVKCRPPTTKASAHRRVQRLMKLAQR
jgi:DNA-binding protein WhiA